MSAPEHHPPRDSAAGLLVAPSLAPTLERDHVGSVDSLLDRRDVLISLFAIVVAIAATAAAELLVRAIALATNLAYFGRLSLTAVAPGDHHLGPAAVIVPVIGGVIVGLMARYGSRAIRGHGIPEAMEQILTNESRIPLKMTFLKPVSSAVSIGTGGPFGAEGPIIATGGALGSALGQVIHVTAAERKTLLAAGAAAGMTAIFGTPIAAVLIAVELLLFEYRARSVVPVALAAAAAGGLRVILHGIAPVFVMPELGTPTAGTILATTAIGAVVGIASTLVTRLVYAVEDGFERLPIHWMWWPALGGIVVGVVGLIEPRTLGVGYDNIELALAGGFTTAAIATLCTAKLVSWAIALGSGTSGGTLAPLMTLGAGLGWLLTSAIAAIIPSAAIDPRFGALVGMTAMFAGASRALLASIVFALEATQQLHAAIPVVAGVTLAYFVSCLVMRTTIMTEKLARRGVAAVADYQVDPLTRIKIDDIATRAVRSIRHDATVAEALAEVAAARHQGYPVLEGQRLRGVVTRAVLLAADPAARVDTLLVRPPVVVRSGATARAAMTAMVTANVGRVIVVDGHQHAVGIVTRSDLINAFSSHR